jgi:hypothetical protein
MSEKKQKFNFYFKDTENNPILTIPFLSDIKLMDGRNLLLILCLTLDLNLMKIVNYVFYSTLEEVCRKYKPQFKNKKEIYFYQNGGKGYSYKKGDIPAILNEDFPQFLYTSQHIIKQINRKRGTFNDSINLTTKEFQVGNAILVSESNYCVIATKVHN